MRRYRNLTPILLLLTIFLSACQATPETAVIANKNGGALETVLEKAMDEERAEVASNEGTLADTDTEAFTYTESFTSTDGNITYNIDIELPAAETALPVLQVTPHTFTSEEAETIAHAIFGDVEFYEYSTEKSKSEIEEEILNLKERLSDRDALVSYYGGNEEIAGEVITDFENRIALLESLYETASDTVVPTECDWQFHSESYYADPELGLSYDDYAQELMAMTWLDGIPYIYQVFNRNADDYRIHNLFAYVDDSLVTRSEKYSSDEITEADITAFLDKTNTLLEQLDMGDWEIENCSAGEWEDEGRMIHTLTIQASPVYNGIKMLNIPQLENLKSEDAYASNYYYERINCVFSGGKLIDFEYDSPLDVVNVVNPAVSILTEDEIIASFKKQMTLDDITGYQMEGIPEKLLDQVPQVTNAAATVDEAEFGLVRTRIKNNESDFYLLPAYLFRGSVNLTYSDGSTEIVNDTIFAVVNAVDGTIINTELGY